MVNRLTPVFRRLKFLPLAGLVALAGCAKNAPQDTWAPEGPNAQTIDNLQKPIFAVAGIVGLIVFGAIGYAVYKLSLIHI